MSRIKKKSNQTNSSAITPTSSKTKVQTGNTSKSVTTLNLNKKDTTSPDDQATITEQQHQMIDELLQRVNTLEGKFFELEGWILVTQRVKSHLENMIDHQEQYSRPSCLVANDIKEPSVEDDTDVFHNIAPTLEKETGIDKDTIANNIDKAHPICRVENGKQLRTIKFRSDHFKEVIYEILKK